MKFNYKIKEIDDEVHICWVNSDQEYLLKEFNIMHNIGEFKESWKEINSKTFIIKTKNILKDLFLFFYYVNTINDMHDRIIKFTECNSIYVVKKWKVVKKQVCIHNNNVVLKYKLHAKCNNKVFKTNVFEYIDGTLQLRDENES